MTAMPAIRRALGFVLGLAWLLASGLTAQARTRPPAAGREGASGVHSYRPGIDVLDYDVALELPERGNAVRATAVLTVDRLTRIDTLVRELVRLAFDSVV